MINRTSWAQKVLENKEPNLGYRYYVTNVQVTCITRSKANVPSKNTTTRGSAAPNEKQIHQKMEAREHLELDDFNNLLHTFKQNKQVDLNEYADLKAFTALFYYMKKLLDSFADSFAKFVSEITTDGESLAIEHTASGIFKAITENGVVRAAAIYEELDDQSLQFYFLELKEKVANDG